MRRDALDFMLGYHWPGNVRELENCIESAVIFADDEITPSTLPLPQPDTTRKLKALTPERLERARRQREASSPPSPGPFDDEPTLRELEARYIAFLLERHDQNRSACARVLEIGRNTLLRKIREYELE